MIPILAMWVITVNCVFMSMFWYFISIWQYSSRVLITIKSEIKSYISYTNDQVLESKWQKRLLNDAKIWLLRFNWPISYQDRTPLQMDRVCYGINLPLIWHDDPWLVISSFIITINVKIMFIWLVAPTYSCIIHCQIRYN